MSTQGLRAGVPAGGARRSGLTQGLGRWDQRWCGCGGWGHSLGPPCRTGLLGCPCGPRLRLAAGGSQEAATKGHVQSRDELGQWKEDQCSRLGTPAPPHSFGRICAHLYLKQRGGVGGPPQKQGAALHRAWKTPGLEGRGGAGAAVRRRRAGSRAGSAGPPLPAVVLRVQHANQEPPCTVQPQGPPLRRGHHVSLDPEGGAVDIS